MGLIRFKQCDRHRYVTFYDFYLLVGVRQCIIFTQSTSKPESLPYSSQSCVKTLTFSFRSRGTHEIIAASASPTFRYSPILITSLLGWYISSRLRMKALKACAAFSTACCLPDPKWLEASVRTFGNEMWFPNSPISVVSFWNIVGVWLLVLPVPTRSGRNEPNRNRTNGPLSNNTEVKVQDILLKLPSSPK